jgi:cytochrome P450
LVTFLPLILEKSFNFLDHLNSSSKTGKPFSLVQLTGNLTFDVIGGIAMGVDFGAQDMDQPDEFICAYRELFQTYESEQMDLPWFFTPLTEWKRRRLGTRLRSTLGAVVRDASLNRQTMVKKSRSILALSLQDQGRILTAEAVEEICDQLSTFLFAGHDTTSILLSWLLYELSRTPRALKRLRDELDEVFGRGKYGGLPFPI